MSPGGGEALIYRGKDKKTKTSGTGRKTVKPEDGTGFKKKKSLSLSGLEWEGSMCYLQDYIWRRGRKNCGDHTPVNQVHSAV